MVRAWWDQTHTHTHTNIRKQTTTGEIITALVAGAKQQQESAENDTAFFNTIVKQNKYLQRKQRNSCETINVISILHPSVTQSVLLCYFFFTKKHKWVTFICAYVCCLLKQPLMKHLIFYWFIPSGQNFEHRLIGTYKSFSYFFFYLGTITCFDR